MKIILNCIKEIFVTGYETEMTESK